MRPLILLALFAAAAALESWACWPLFAATALSVVLDTNPGDVIHR